MICKAAHAIIRKSFFGITYCSYDFSDRIKDLDYKQLPACFHRYFEEDVQELDKLRSLNGNRFAKLRGLSMERSSSLAI